MSDFDREEFRRLFEALADPQVACDGQERVIFLTRSAERLLGWKFEELRGQPVTVLIPPRLHTIEGQSVLRHLLRRNSRLSGRPLLMPFQRRGGEELLLEVTTGSSGDGAHERIVLSLRKKHVNRLRDLARAAEVPLSVLGEVRGRRLRIGSLIDVNAAELRQAWANALPRRMEG